MILGSRVVGVLCLWPGVSVLVYLRHGVVVSGAGVAIPLSCRRRRRRRRSNISSRRRRRRSSSSSSSSSSKKQYTQPAPPP